MPIKSSRMGGGNNDEEPPIDKNQGRVLGPSAMPEDEGELSLRPKKLSEYIGQPTIKKNLTIAITAAKMRREAMEHILLHGPPGLGKTSLAGVIANEMGSNFKATSGPAIEKPGDLVAILSNLEEGTILFIDEIHRLKDRKSVV